MESKQKRMLFIRFCYWLAAILDALLAGDLLLYVLFGTTIYLQYPTLTPITQFLARQVIPLVIGWTILLIWAVQKPVERRIILIFTALPLLLLGILLDLVLLLLGNKSSSLGTNLISFIIQMILMILMLIGFIIANQLKKINSKWNDGDLQ